MFAQVIYIAYILYEVFTVYLAMRQPVLIRK